MQKQLNVEKEKRRSIKRERVAATKEAYSKQPDADDYDQKMTFSDNNNGYDGTVKVVGNDKSQTKLHHVGEL